MVRFFALHNEAALQSPAFCRQNNRMGSCIKHGKRLLRCEIAGSESIVCVIAAIKSCTTGDASNAADFLPTCSAQGRSTIETTPLLTRNGDKPLTNCRIVAIDVAAAGAVLHLVFSSRCDCTGNEIHVSKRYFISGIWRCNGQQTVERCTQEVY